MSTSRFLFFDGLGSLFYGTFYVLAGFLFHNQVWKAMAVLNQLGFSALLLALVLVTGYIAFKYARRRTCAGGYISTGHGTQEFIALASSGNPIISSVANLHPTRGFRRQSSRAFRW